jgi:V/A-type H+-transporting ATPase subunit A
MTTTSQGTVTGVNGNLLRVRFSDRVIQNEVAFVQTHGQRLKCEVIRIQDDQAEMQIFEDARGVRVGDSVEFTGELLSVELGPGLLKMVYDGLQNPLNELARQSGFFLQRGLYLDALDRETRWEFTPSVAPGARLQAGDYFGSVPEGIFTHQLMLPFAWRGIWTVEWIAPAGSYSIAERMLKVVNDQGERREATMVQRWPVKLPITAYRDKILPHEPLVTQCRIVDTFFPVARGGTFCIPGPFGAGKTVLQQAISQYSETDIVVVAACGERAGEVVEVLREFPHLPDPRTGKTLMDRTVIICNTSSMPVAAREASVYTAITIAEYYRQMALNVLLLADSTSRWAQALREMSGRLEEIPGEEAFPAYLESVIANFYERAGLVELRTGRQGSVTIGGTVSPAGGNFEEPVTQATLKVVGCFLGLSRDRANARRFPAIHPLDSWSKYPSIVESQSVIAAKRILHRGREVHQMMMVVGEEGTSLGDYIIYLKGEFLDAVFLQQNTFDKVDAACSSQRQTVVLEQVLTILNGRLHFTEKEAARSWFNHVRQLFIDWNYLASQSDEFNRQAQAIKTAVTEAIHA